MPTPTYNRDWYLIQRLRTRQVPRPGFVAIHDYMGSAEFEWGSVPKAWNALREAVSSGNCVSFRHPSLVVFGSDSEPKPVYVILSVVLDIGSVCQDLILLADRKFQTKEHTDFDRYRENCHPRNRPDGWISVSESDGHNPVFFTSDKALHDSVLENLRNPVPESRIPGLRQVSTSPFTTQTESSSK